LHLPAAGAARELTGGLPSLICMGMPKLRVIKLPDPILREKSLPVETVDAQLRTFLSDMLETMYAAPGIGLAAVQVGVLRRMLVIDTARGEDEPKRPLMLINPEILSKGDTPRVHEEGCLSIPEMYAEVQRPALVRVRYVDIEEENGRIPFSPPSFSINDHQTATS
jgi:peptide deformylase